MRSSSTRIESLPIPGVLLSIKFHAIAAILEDTPNIDLNCLSEKFIPVFDMATAITMFRVNRKSMLAHFFSIVQTVAINICIENMVYIELINAYLKTRTPMRDRRESDDPRYILRVLR